MSEADFATNLLRSMLANLYFQTSMQVSREMFQKSYFSLGNAEKIAVDQAAFGHVASNYNALTPEFYGQPDRQPVGFGTAHPAPMDIKPAPAEPRTEAKKKG